MFVCTVNPNDLDIAGRTDPTFVVVHNPRFAWGEPGMSTLQIVAGSVREIEDIRNELAATA